jgi:hypothetical protein
MGCFNSKNKKLILDLKIIQLYKLYNDMSDMYDKYEIYINNKKCRILALAKYIHDDSTHFFLNTTNNIFIIIKFMKNSRVSVHKGSVIELYNEELSPEIYEKYIEEMTNIEKMWKFFY